MPNIRQPHTQEAKRKISEANNLRRYVFGPYDLERAKKQAAQVRSRRGRDKVEVLPWPDGPEKPSG
jgi:hypothetical protein